MALSLLGAMLSTGWGALAKPSSIFRALAPVRLALTTLWFGVFLAAPWIYLVPWRPRALPATSVELAFIIAKLAVAAVLMAIGVALIIRQSSNLRDEPS